MRTTNQKIFILAIALAASVIGIFMTFFYERDPKSDEHKQTAYTASLEQEEDMGNRATEQPEKHDYSGKELPLEENAADVDTYNGERAAVEVYFSNTEMLDTSAIPLEAQAVLSTEVQTFLRRRGYGDVSELYIDDESFLEQGDMISFECFMDGYIEKLQIVYDSNENTLKYYIIDINEGG